MKRMIVATGMMLALTACSAAETVETQDASNVLFLKCTGSTTYDTSNDQTSDVKFYKIDKSERNLWTYFDENIDYPLSGVEISDQNIKVYNEFSSSDTKSFTNIDFDIYSGTVSHRTYNEHRGSRLFTIQVNFSGHCERVDGPPTHAF